MNYSVLVVDDFGPWRRRVAAELARSDRWRVIGECADGPDAVREAAARKPDIIILDISLESMNGVEAARRILADDPRARILFLTGQHSPEVAEAALAIGARGYLLKPEAGGALPRALEAVAAGARFISPGLPRDLVDATTPETSGRRHAAVFHSTDTAIAGEYARFAEHALGRGRPVVVVAPRASLDIVQARLETRGVPVGRAIDEGRYLAFDVDVELSKVMPGRHYDRERFRDAAEAILREAAGPAAPGRRAAVCGEVAPQLWKDGRGYVAIDIEHLWDEVVTATGADLLCGYSVDQARLADAEYSVFHQICGMHEIVHVS